MKQSRAGVSPALVFVFTSIAWALVPGDLHQKDVLIPALFHTEDFQEQQAHVPNTLQDAKAKLEAAIQKEPSKPEPYQALAEINEKLLDFAAAEINMKLFVEKSANKDAAFTRLESFYHNRLRFEDELRTLQEHASALTVRETDVSSKSGRYAIFKKIIQHIGNYGLNVDVRTFYLESIQSYPAEQKPYLEFIQYVKNTDKKAAVETLEKFKAQFPNDNNTYLLTRASLLTPEEAFDLMNRSFHPLWNQNLYRAFDGYLIATERKRDYLESLKDRLQNNPLDVDAVARLFHAYHLAGNLIEAQNTLNDFRLLKEEAASKKSSWSAKELYWMASLNQKLLNYNDASRFYYALYEQLIHKPERDLTADLALCGLFEILLAAQDRPVQLGAGNLDYYKDIATMDQNPGILNGILSLILNGTNPASELEMQQDKASGYFNRAEALRLVRLTRRHFPNSRYLAGMYRDSLRIFEKYGMDKLLVEAGEEFFRQFRNAPEIFEVGVAVADAYARLKDHQKEWRTYQFLLPIAAERKKSGSLLTWESSSEDEHEEDEEGWQEQTQLKQQFDYQLLLNRYIASLTNQKEHLQVVRLYQQEITQHPDEETLYENFASYLAQNQLFEEEKKLYEQAISRFQGKGWYEKLARWFLRNERQDEYEKLSQQIMDIFRGTEIEKYLDQTARSHDQLFIALNLYAHEKFPLNVNFVHNLISYYKRFNRTKEWVALATQYYFLDEEIRNQFLSYLSASKRLPETLPTGNAIYTRFTGDVAAWKSHFEDATSHYEELAKKYPADPEINLRLADLKRSLGTQDVENYSNAAKIRAHLASISPSDSTLWTTAGETMADIEHYDQAINYWNEILKIDPYNPDRYVEVATIYWDYYLFDHALETIAKIRKLKKYDYLFAYEAGAIYESKRNYEKAIAEYARSLPYQSGLAWDRLGELYQRKKYTERIRKHIEEQLKKEYQNEPFWTGTVHFYTKWHEMALVRHHIGTALASLNKEPFGNIAENLKQTARDLGFNDLYEKILNRQIADAATDLDRWNRALELARFYEASKNQEKAEEVYVRLYKQQPRSAGFIQELLSFYWRTEQYGESFAIYKDVLAAANPIWRKKYLLEVTNKYRERKDFAPALIHARELLSAEPLNAQYFRLVAEILAEQKDYASLTPHYKEGLQKVRESKLTDDEKKQRIAELRRGIIHANVILKNFTAALDQYIEIINRDAESEEGLKEAADFAARYGLNPRLFDYYAKTAAASPKDHRWPMVLGRLHLFTGDFQPAIEQFQTAISIRPERVDFYQQVAEAFQRLGKYEEAIAGYEKAYELSYKNKRWLEPMAELHARLGHEKKALELYEDFLNEKSEMNRNFALARQALDWGFLQSAVSYGKAGQDQYFKDTSVEFNAEGLHSYLEALIRSGKRIEAFSVLRLTSNRIAVDLKRATFATEQLRSAQYMVRDLFGNRYAALLRQYYTEEDWQSLHRMILQQIAQNMANQDHMVQELLPLVRSAQMAPAEERLLLALAEYHRTLPSTDRANQWNQYSQWHSQVVSFYKQRHEYGRCAAWMEAEFEKYRAPKHHRELVEIARLYRLAEETDQELSVLRRYYGYGISEDLQPESVERYLDLLYAKDLTDELKQAAAAANLISVNYFLRKKDKPLSILAIEFLYRRYKKDPSWKSIQLAMIGWQTREASDRFDKSFSNALALQTIGEVLNTDRDPAKTIEGDDWFYYGRAYGEYLLWTGRREQAIYYLPSDLEGASTASLRQDQLGAFYFQEKQSEQALKHFTLALQLDPDNLQYLDHRARALIEIGKKEEAIAVWKGIVAAEKHRNDSRAWHFYLKAAAEFGFLDRVRNEVEEFIDTNIRKTGAVGVLPLIQLYLQNAEPEYRNQLISKWMTLAPAPAQFGQALRSYNLSPAVNLRIYAAVNEYLESRLISAVGQEQTTLRNEFWRWNQRYAKTLMDSGDSERAAKVLAEVQEKFEATEDSQTKEAILILSVHALTLAGKEDKARKFLNDFLRTADSFEDPYGLEERYKKALETLKETSLETALKEEMYSWLLSIGRTDDGNYIGLAEVKLQKNQTEEAKELLRKMIYLNGENLKGFHAAAELWEKHQQWENALSLREELLKRNPRDEVNQSRLAEDFLQLNREPEAAKLAQKVIVSTSAPAEDRTLAAKVYGKSASGLFGPLEMKAIERAVRGQQTEPQPYSRNLRGVLLEMNPDPPSALIRAELFLRPQEESLQRKLFQAYVRENKCLQALATLDPNQERSGTYSSGEMYFGRGNEYYYDDYSSFPVERFGLSDEETRTIALQMADCSHKQGDISGEIFFRQMARSHTRSTEEQDRLTDQLLTLQQTLAAQKEADEQNYRIGLNIGRNQ
ncbi:hypothetical protein L0156_07185 [bacterium]|nr:hypothetical protein [bacterium]